MSSSLIPFSQATISGSLRKTVDARELHSFLEVGKDFSSWLRARIEKYGFIEDHDFVSSPQIGGKPQGGRPAIEYHLTLDMAKELAMVENNEKGREARRYFIECERMAKQIAPPTDNVRLLEAQNERIRLTIQVREAFADDAIMQSIVADAIKNTLGGQAALPAPALFQAYEILEEAGFTPKGIRSVGPTFGRRLAKAWREETGQQPLTTKRVVDGATRNVKCYPASFRQEAIDIALELT